ncbi:GumC family protein [Hymenobacter sp. GOD-10R]|uniref:GumC family protein n=1 Tax=Hymenobacter sp. GOD-10R TaxID=3093922 RepID=UPI002D7A0250|nr:polysaccharide biosynthesis tyrosine autokinase [Hymenobacter sp. GOD-10R]WRQ28802.1 polysaccharide biosynthesis tyrosine autokinase [Hymenobacter sp. GOD-10R]
MESRHTASDEIDLHELFFKLSKRWPLFLASVLIAGLSAWMYLQVKAPTYDFRSTLLIGNQSTGSKQAQELLQLLDPKDKGMKLEDEVGLLTSTDMLRRTLTRLPFAVSYYTVPDSWLNSVKNLQVREQAIGGVPFRVLPVPNKPQLVGVPIYVEPQQDGRYRVHADIKKGELHQLASGELVREVLGTQLDQTVRAGDTLRSPLLTAVIAPEPSYPAMPTKERFFFKLQDMPSLVGDYQNRLKVKPIEHESRILELATQGSVPSKETQFLNTLMAVYVEEDLNQKNQIGRKTITFLDNEINKIAQARLSAAEAVSSFRASAGVVDATAQSGAGIQRQSELQSAQARLATNLKYYQNMIGYMRSRRAAGQTASPSTAGIEDPAILALVQQLAKLNAERTSVALNATAINPQLLSLDEQIVNTKESLIQTLANLIRTANISLSDVNHQLAQVRTQISQMPENERRLAALRTRSDFTDKNYNLLVEKRNEAAIALATNSTDKKVVDPAKQNGIGPSAPKPGLVGLIALLAALAIPTGIVLLSDKTNRRIQSKDDLSKVTNIPLLGVVPHGTSADKQSMLHDPRSPISEAFRSIRVSLQYLSTGPDKRFIGVTSSVPGEGKTFCTVNLAAELAQGGRRVILLECDMRRPTMAGYFGIDTRRAHGLSTYLAGTSTLEEARISTDVPNLDAVCCGPIPENPTQLLESRRLSDLMQQLREDYDYVLVDIPPMGYVAEFFVLLRYLDANIYVVRQNYTDRGLVNQISELHRDQKVKQIYMIINDVHFAQTYEYRYKGKSSIY